MGLIDRARLKEVLMREQGKYILSDHMQSKHISAGFMLAIAELDSQPDVEAITIEDLRRIWRNYYTIYGHGPEEVETLIDKWKKEKR